MKNFDRKKILFLITKSNWGGGQRYVFDLATHMDTDMFDIVVALGGDGELSENLKKAGIRVIQIPGLQRDVSLVQEIRASKSIAQIIKNESPDILHLNSSKAGAIGALLGRLLRTKYIVFTALGWAFNEDRPWWQKFIIKCIHWSTVLLSHKTIAISHGMKEQMQWPLAQHKIHVIHLGRHVREPQARHQARKTIGMHVTEKYGKGVLSAHMDNIWIGSLSELHPIKQLDKAINAFALLKPDFPNVRYVIIGDGQEASRLAAQIKTLGLENNIFLAGSIFEAGGLLGAFDLFLFPSRSEAFGYVLLEAGAATLPVVSTNVPGILDVVTNEETGLLVSPDSTNDLHTALRRVLTDDALRARLAAAHYKRSQLFTVEKMVSETTALYTTA
jgi:glycosyltransferase involved in cell wall biosynthesis